MEWHQSWLINKRDSLKYLLISCEKECVLIWTIMIHLPILEEVGIQEVNHESLKVQKRSIIEGIRDNIKSTTMQDSVEILKEVLKLLKIPNRYRKRSIFLNLILDLNIPNLLWAKESKQRNSQRRNNLSRHRSILKFKWIRTFPRKAKFFLNIMILLMIKSWIPSILEFLRQFNLLSIRISSHKTRWMQINLKKRMNLFLMLTLNFKLIFTPQISLRRNGVPKGSWRKDLTLHT